MNAPSTTFDVSRVPLAGELLLEFPGNQAIHDLISLPLRQTKQELQEQIGQFRGFEANLRRNNPERLAQFKQQLDAFEQQLATVEANEAAQAMPIEASSCHRSRLVGDVSLHPFLAALHLAFTEHRPLCLSPDMIWLLICQGVADHIHVNAETLRSRFVRHEGKAQIAVRRDDFVKGSPDNPWSEVIDEFSSRVKAHIGPAQDLFVPQFSTTGATERIAAEIVLLGAMQSYFKYVLRTLCGIPAITLEGTPEDWRELARRAGAFAEFDLEWWLTPLQPLLQEFVAAASGRIRRAFWESIYRFQSFSGGAAITGWIAAFFPYFKDQGGRPTERNPWLREGGEKLSLLLAGKWAQKQFDLGSPKPGVFPSGLTLAPFTWKYLDETIAMQFLAGFVGVAQDPSTLTLRPEIGWAVRKGVR